MTRFTISDQPIDPTERLKALQNFGAGACVTFEGRIRDQNDGCEVTHLDYEVFQSLAVAEGRKILEEAVHNYGLLAAEAVHREGRLALGECAVWIGVLSSHRGEAFAACRFIIDTIKHRLPIWKKEFYADGRSVWARCQHHGSEKPHETRIRSARALGTATAPITEHDFYARQLRLPEIGVEGQAKLTAARVLVVGAGGLGSAALRVLASAGVGLIGIIEPDRLEASNLHRQTLYRFDDVGEPKVELAAQRLRSLNPFITIETYLEQASAKNLPALLKDYDIVLDCTDNFTAKYLLNDASVLFGKTLIQASLYRFEGQLLTIAPNRASGCLRCLWAEQPAEGLVGDCADVGVLGAAPALFGTLQANEAIKIILGLDADAPHEIFTFDLLSLESQRLKRTRNRDCPLCGDNPSIHALTPDASEGFDVAVHEGDTRESLLDAYRWIDVREDDERQQVPLPEALPYAMSRMDEAVLDVGKDENLLLICAKGGRSRRVAEKLRARGWTESFSLKGGLQNLPSCSVAQAS